MDDHGPRGPGRRPDDDQVGDERAPETDQDYYWGGRPGEDFGPIAPPGPSPTSADRRRLPPLDADDAATWPRPVPPRPTTRRGVPSGRPLRPDGTFTGPERRRQWRAIFALVGALFVLGGLTAAVLVVISREDMAGLVPGLVPRGLMGTAPSPEPATSSPAAAVTSVATSPLPAAHSPVPASSPTRLTLAAPSPPPVAVRSPTARPTARPASAILPTPPSILIPPGLRTPTATPARLASPQAARTPLPLPTPRPPNIVTRAWSDQVIYRVGDDASICGQTSAGSRAELVVLAPDRTTRTLGEFATPAERICFVLKVDQPELWVLTLIVKDGGGVEIERQSGAIWVSR